MEEKWIEAEDIDVEKIMDEIRKRVEDKKKKGIYKEEEIEDIENVELLPLPDILDVPIVYNPEDLEKSYQGIEHLGDRKVKELKEVRNRKLPVPPISGAKKVIKNFILKVREKIFPLIKLLSFFTLTDLYDGVKINSEKIDAAIVSIESFISETSHYLNIYKEHIKVLHNYIHHITTEITKLKVENDELKVKTKELESRLSFLEDRERALEKETVDKK